MSFSSVLRSRSLSALILFGVIAAALLAVPAVARGQAYPPTGPSSTSVSSSTSAPAAPVPESNHQAGGTASTGFQTLTATGIAIALLGGGIGFVVAGRRRRGAG